MTDRKIPKATGLTRIINGRKYHAVMATENKNVANKLAKGRREHGKRVRVLKVEGKWTVFDGGFRQILSPRKSGKGTIHVRSHARKRTKGVRAHTRKR